MNHIKKIIIVFYTNVKCNLQKVYKLFPCKLANNNNNIYI